MLTTPGLMKFYNCSDFPFNFNFIVGLTLLTLADRLTGAALRQSSIPTLLCNYQGRYVHRAVANWLNNLPEGKVANWILGNHDYWR